MNRDQVEEYKKKFESFLDFDIQNEYDTYGDRLVDMVESGETTRFIIQMEHVREFTGDPQLLEFLKDPTMWIYSWEEGLNDYIRQNNQDGLEEVKKKFGDNVRYQIGFDGVMGSLLTSPRFLLSRHLNRFVCVEGIITRSGLVSPRIQRSVHFAEGSAKYVERNYNDETNILGRSSVVVFPKTLPDSEEKLEVEYGLCSYKDTQTIFLQEAPESSRAGQLPRSVSVHLENDLVDLFKPGDRVKVVGIFHLVRPPLGNRVPTRIKSVVNASNILASEEKDWTLQSGDVKRFRNLNNIAENQGKDMLDILCRSVAPSIYGHENIKKALLLQLVGGVERILENGIKQRGDIHILLVGDPGTAKSQLVRFCMNVATISISTTGRASTGVGLTAAVVRDPDTGEPSLAAGAMVLGDRGLVGVDEFDKMNEVDRASMHEVMEQQTCTIQKAGVHTTLNSRVSVLAAANPIFGSYNPKISVQKNVGLPDSLLSRFDLVFIVLDKKSKELDREIATHVCRLHLNYEEESKKAGSSTKKGKKGGQSEDIEEKLLSDNGVGIDLDNCVFSLSFLRKYVKFAKRRVTPVLDDDEDLINMIAQKYDEMRELAGTRHNDPSEDEDGLGMMGGLSGRAGRVQTSLPVTPRALEGLVRLIKAHSRLRLSPKVERVDVDAAYELMKSTIFLKEEEIERMKTGDIKEKSKKKKKKKKKKKRMLDEDDEEEEEEDDEDDDEEGGDGKVTGKKRSREEMNEAETLQNLDPDFRRERMIDMIQERLLKLVKDEDLDDIDQVMMQINQMLITQGFDSIRDKDLVKLIDDRDWQYIISLESDERSIYYSQ